MRITPDTTVRELIQYMKDRPVNVYDAMLLGGKQYGDDLPDDIILALTDAEEAGRLIAAVGQTFERREEKLPHGNS